MFSVSDLYLEKEVILLNTYAIAYPMLYILRNSYHFAEACLYWLKYTQAENALHCML